MFRMLLALLVFMGSFMLVLPMEAQALLVHFNPSPVNVEAGDAFAVDLFADIGSDEQLLGWDVDLVFDDTQLGFTGATVGSRWNALTPIPDDDVSIAGVAPFGLPMGTGISGEGVLLATLHFNCLAAGSSTLGIATDDAKEGFALVPPGAFAQWDCLEVTINQTGGTGPAPVPEPATMLLLGTGLLGLCGAVRRKRP